MRPGGIAPSGDITGFYIAGGIYHGFLLTKKANGQPLTIPGSPTPRSTRILPMALSSASITTGPTQHPCGPSSWAAVGTPSYVPCTCPHGATPDGKVLVGYHKEGPNYAANPWLVFVMDDAVFTSFRSGQSLVDGLGHQPGR